MKNAKRVLIAGSRHYNNYEEASMFIKEILQKEEASFIVLSGGSDGADRLGERFAGDNAWNVEIYPAKWKQFGRAAGPIRNKQMVDNADICICFWDGKSKGTHSVIKLAQKAHKPLHIKIIAI